MRGRRSRVLDRQQMLLLPENLTIRLVFSFLQLGALDPHKLVLWKGRQAQTMAA
jgi:hypothetical protein